MAIAAGGVLTPAGAEGASAGASPATDALGGTAAGFQDPSSLRCHLELPVRVRGHRFESSYDGSAITCAGMLLGRPVAAGALPKAEGVAAGMHLAPTLPPRIDRTNLSLETIDVGLPYDPAVHTPIKVRLEPVPASVNGVGHFAGVAHIRRRHHQVEAIIAFRPNTSTQNRRCCSAGRLIVDMSIWQVSTRR